MNTKTARIRALNDELRQHITGGMAVITLGVAALGPEAVERIVKTIAVFDDFCRANDLYRGARTLRHLVRWLRRSCARVEHVITHD